jgi:hypothetical protein
MLTSIVVQGDIEKFIAELEKSLTESTFVKLTLGNYKGDDKHLQKISARVVETRKGHRLVLQYRYDQRDIIKNFEVKDGIQRVSENLDTGFRSAHLFTTRNDLQLTIGKRNSRLISAKPTFQDPIDASHDRKKKHLIDPSVYYLKALGITTDTDQVRADQRDKWTQINKFVEVLAALSKNSSLKDKGELRIVDMGSGKGYLTFAIFDFFSTFIHPPSSFTITGVEQRKDLVDLCNDIARVSEFQGLSFVQGTIADFDLGDVDILIALHACDTATDDALYKGIRADAEIIVAAPCCHHELKKQIKPPELLADILKHPVLLERTAETLTDGIRSMMLEANGYKTKMFEFVATEHTPKNNLLVATKHKEKKNDRANVDQIGDIRHYFGINHQRLVDLLAAN